MTRPDQKFHSRGGWPWRAAIALGAGAFLAAASLPAADSPRPADSSAAAPAVVAPATPTNAVAAPEPGPSQGTNANAGATPRSGDREAAGARSATPTNSPSAVTPGTNAPPADAGPDGGAPLPRVGPGSTYGDFKLISDRNIFNPNRTRRSSRGGGDGPKSKPTVVQTLSLVGIMSYGSQDLAFFDGSASSLRKVAHTNDTVAGGQVLQITPTQVRMKLEGKDLTLAVGAKFRREDEGAWTLVEPGGKPAASESSAGTGSAGGGDGEAAKSEGGGEESDILKRLMQRREQEKTNEKE